MRSLMRGSENSKTAVIEIMKDKEKRVKAILFDLGKVIVNYDVGLLEDGYSAYGSVPKGVMNDYIMKSDIGKSYMEGRINSSKFFYKTYRYFKLRIKYAEFYQVWNSIFSPYPEVEGIIRGIRRIYPDVRLILVSDTNEAHFEFIQKEYSVLGLMDHRVLSYKVGRMKPHPDVFKEAIRLAGAAAKEILYVDDRFDLIEAARTMGLCAYQFMGHVQLRDQLKKFNINV